MRITLNKLSLGLAIGFILVFMSVVTGAAHAHPEDEFCNTLSGMDRELCRQLAAMDSSSGDEFTPLLDEAGEALSGWESAWYFLEIGVNHILPGGTDHILFVLALFLAAQSLKNLAIQISVFTVAHTVTLGLTAAGVIQPPASVVEPLIALSIAVVAIENLFTESSASLWRLLIIFGFGLFHGMGFAGFVSEIGLPPEQFWPSLIGFNIGVEIGQLAVVALAVLISIPLKPMLAGPRYSYRNVVVIPASLIIAAIGTWWAITRSLGM